MKPLEICYLAAGPAHTTSQMRARALARCGHRVRIVDMTECTPRNLWVMRFHRVTGCGGLDRPAERLVRARTDGARFDLVWVDNGTVVGPRCAAALRKIAPALVNYNLDDPTGRRDGNRWRNFLRAIPAYDLMVTVRRETEQELLARGARRVRRVFRSYDELEHAPLELDAAAQERWQSEVLFAGTWMPERSVLFRQLVRAGR